MSQRDRVSSMEANREVRRTTVELSPTVAEERERRIAKVRPVVKEQEEGSQGREEEAKSSTNPPETNRKQQKHKTQMCCILQ